MRRYVWCLVGLLALVGCAKESSGPPSGNPTVDPKGSDSPTPSVPVPSGGPATGGPATGAPAADQGEGNTSATPASEGGEESPVAGISPQLMELLQTGELDKAVESLQASLAKDPKNRSLSLLLIRILEGQAIQQLQTGEEAAANKSFEVAAVAAEKFAAEMSPLAPEEGSVIGTAMYNGACVLAKGGKLEEAEKRLQAAFNVGFNDVDQAKKDDDFAALRERESFQKILSDASEAQIAAAKKEAEEQFEKFESFPFDFTLTDVEDKERKLADYKGKVLIVDIWGTWCPPCRMEIPHFVELHKRYKDAGLEIVGVNYEEGEAAEVKALIKKFMEENGMTYTCVVGDDATRERVPNFEGFPTTLFIDRTGKVRLKEVGYKPLASLEAIVVKLLDEK